MVKLQKVLYISKGFPRKGKQSNYPFIGFKLAFLQKHGVHADVLWIKKINFRNRNNFFRIAKYLALSIFPLIHFENNRFRDKKYSIYEINYTFLSRYWLPVIILILSKLKGYSLLHYHFLWSAGELVYLRKKLKLPAILSIRGSDMHEQAVNNPGLCSIYKSAIASADRIIYVSEALRNCAKSIGLDTDKDIVINNGYDPESFSLTYKNKDIPVFGFVGHLYHVKGVDKLPFIFKYIREQLPAAELLMVGGDSGKKKLSLKKVVIETFEELGLKKYIKFAGEVLPYNMIEYYSKMDILFLPSRNEGFPNVVLEARACGVPVVGSNNGGIPEAIGSGGVIVPDGDDFERRFAAAAVKLYNNLPSRHVIHNEVAPLTWDNVILREISVYNKLLENRTF